MAGELTISWGNLDNLFTSMQEIQDQGASVDTYFADQVCSTAGFDYDYCVLSPIAGQLSKVAGAFTDMRGIFDERWQGTMEAMMASAKEIDATDNSVSLDFGRYLGDAPMGPYAQQDIPTDVGIDIEVFPLSDVAAELKAPGAGAKTMPHNSEWETIVTSFDEVRDAINSGISKINSIGAVHIDSLTEKSLDEFVVYPLSGNYLKMQGNSFACDNVNNAMTKWSTNFGSIAGKSVAAMGGDMGIELGVHLGLYSLVTKLVGELVGAGAKVFKTIADVSEEIAVSVENALVTMAKILLRVSARIASRMAGVFGWMAFVADVVEKGTAAVTDIIDDVKTAVEIIHACFELKETIEAWAEEKAAQLEAFQEMATMVQQLPEAASGGGLGGIPPVDPGVLEGNLGSVTYSFGENPDTKDDLDDELDDLNEDYPDELGDDEPSSSQDLPEPDDGEVLMAPGPIGSPPSGLPGGFASPPMA